MSYSRWQDERYWQAFRDALLSEHPSVTAEGLMKAKEFNAQRYYYQGIGRFDPDAAMARGLADLAAISALIPERGFVHGSYKTECVPRASNDRRFGFRQFELACQ